jgi:TatD DNase family protein
LPKIYSLLINIHSHQPAKENEWVIQNLYKHFEKYPTNGFFSAGLHPWYIQEPSWQEELAQLKKISKEVNILAIGECGLDKACDTDLKFQQEVFISQLLWANIINKPILIHCVRAHEEILQIIKHYKSSIPVIFHGFNKNLNLAHKILEEGHWLSFGKAILQPEIANIFRSLPVEKIFLETDDDAVTIETIYTTAALIKNVSEVELSWQLSKNLFTVFKVIV